MKPKPGQHRSPPPIRIPPKGSKRPPFRPQKIVGFEEMPGFLEALEPEQRHRDAAYLGLNQNIAGFEVRPLLFRQYLFLRFIRSPLLVGGTPQPEDIIRFLWLLNPGFTTEAKARANFVRRCRALFVPPSPPLFRTRVAMLLWKRKVEEALENAATVVDAIRQFVDETLMDHAKNSGWQLTRDFYSDACSVCNLVGRELHRSREETLNTPMAMLLQELREIRHHNLGAKAGLGNPFSDQAMARWLKQQNAKEKN